MVAMPFEFGTAGRILFGAGTVREAGAIISALGTRVMAVTGQSWERADPLLAELRARRFETLILSVAQEPDVEFVRMGAAFARAESIDVVVGFGGGSAIDAGKAIAALATNTGDPLDYLEVVGRGLPLAAGTLPYVAIPTTAGTGAEATRNAVLTVPGQSVKASLRSHLMLPRVALIDPELTYDLPAGITASTGLDALTQLIEPYLSTRANPMTDTLCVDGMCRVAGALRRVVENGRDAGARADMSLAALFGGMALGSAGLGAVHGLAAPIGGMFGAAHGAVCAALLPHVLAVNLRALRQRAPGCDALRRADQVGRLLTGRPQAGADAAVEWLANTCRELPVPPLSAHGVTRADVPRLVERAAQSNSMRGNPIELTSSELSDALYAALD
jgi:alcohol dehydrogenase class IV